MSQTHPLIAIKAHLINGKTVQTVNARDLYHFLEVRLSFSTWMKNHINRYEWVDNTDYLVFTHSGPHAGRPFKDYVLTLEKAKEMTMLTCTEKVRALENRLNEILS